MKIPGIKIPRLKKIPNPGDLPKIPGIFRKSRKNPDSQKMVKTQNFFLYVLKVFKISVESFKSFRPNLGYQKVLSIINRCFFKGDWSEIGSLTPSFNVFQRSRSREILFLRMKFFKLCPRIPYSLTHRGSWFLPQVTFYDLKALFIRKLTSRALF